MRLSRLSSLAMLAAITTASPAYAARPTAGSITNERLKLPSGPSSVRGLADEPDVDPRMAQLEYEVPIELPPGLGGLTPTLALAYSGALGNGPVGIGWTLGESKIERSTRLGVPRFDDTDTLELAGIAPGRLVAIGGGEYRVEGSGQTVRVRRAVDGFEVDDGNGVRYRFGITASAREERDATHALAWRLEEQTNLMGERIRYEYTRDRGQLYLARIVWGPSDAYRVDLVYEARPDVTTSYREGYRVETAKRLAAIRVTAFGVERRAYQLTYDATFPLARLAGVSSTGRAGSGAWPALSFTYATPGTPALAPVTGIGNWRLNASGTTLVDLDGDGAAEMLQLTSGGHSYLTNSNGAFAGLQPLAGNAQSIANVQLHDIDGDGRAELLQDTGNGWAVYKFSRTQWVSQAASLPDGVWPGTPGLALKQPTTTRFADLDGNSLIDAIKWDNDNLKIHTATRTGISAPYNVPRIGGTVLPSAQGRFLDVNGDGLDDYVVIANTRIDRYLGRGDGTFDAAVMVAYPFAGTLSNPEDIELADLDRDGLLDLVRIELGTVRWFRGRADGTFVTSAVTLANPETLSTAVVVAVTDMDGNGSHDVVWSSTSGMWRMDLAGATTAGMMVRVQNGLGMDVGFAYRSSHALGVEAKLAGSAWGSHVPIAMPVPVEKTTALGPGDVQRRISYSVRDPFWDAIEQRFAGFLTTTVTTAGATPAETSTVITRYHAGTGDTRVLRGKPLVEQVKNGAGTRLSMTTSTWEALPVAGLPDVPLLRRAVLRDVRMRFEESTPIRETHQTHEYDALGRVRRTVDHGRLDLDHDDSIREVRYADDDTTWIRDRTCEEKLLTGGGELVSHTQHLFGDNTAVHALCVAGKGWPRETRAWLAGESRFVTSSTSAYDARGNVVTAVTGGVTRGIVYDTDGLFPLEERVQSAPGVYLTSTATWDRVLGVTETLSDPNGHVTRATYDALGRMVALAIAGRPAHMHIDYDWVAPFPKTTTWQFDGAVEDLGPRPANWSEDSGWRQSVEVANGSGELRYRALRRSDAEWIISDYAERDPASRVVFRGRPMYSTQLQLASRPAAMTGDQLAYDPIGRLLEQRLATGARKTFAYSAFEITTREDQLAPVRSVTDGRSRVFLTERSLPDGTQDRVEARYDAAGRITTMWLGGGSVTRTFRYDTLGRLVESNDPDIGVRTLAWDDAGRLVREENAAGQVVRYQYDAAGRLIERTDGATYRYHYDRSRTGERELTTNLAGRIAWIEEPTGTLDYGYDDHGRTTFTRRRIDDRSVEHIATYSASGLVRQRSYDDGLALTYDYDPAGRLVGVANLWHLLEQDAAGHPLREQFGNGVVTTYARDALGLVSEIAVRDDASQLRYDVAISRAGWTGIQTVTDRDGVGLDHTATFTYDAFSRLTGAQLGMGAARYTFGYAYDALHNMTSRTATGPTSLGMYTGSYRYGERGSGPRQLTSTVDGAITHQLTYDEAGRQITRDGAAMTYDALDRLLRVDGLPEGSVTHAYGHDGARVRTQGPRGETAYWYGDHISDRLGRREHEVVVGERVIARATMVEATSPGPIKPPGQAGVGALGVVAVGALLLLRTRRRARRGLAALFVLAAACVSDPSTDTVRSSVWSAPRWVYMHTGIGAGPTLFSDTTGAIIEERRFEPFGQPLDARIGMTTTTPDLVARDLNVLNKRTEAASGWSDHGARWMAPETARWLTPDPPVKGPDPKMMKAPWQLHPYQYVHQNPIAYWDPDGREGVEVESEPTPSEEIKNGFKDLLVPGLGQVDGMKLALRPLQSEGFPTAAKVAYAIVLPPIMVALGARSEFDHMQSGLFHIVKGTGRMVKQEFSPVKGTPIDPAIPLERVPVGVRGTFARDEVAKPPPTQESLETALKPWISPTTTINSWFSKLDQN